MTKYTIVKKKTELSDEEIERHKDFGKIKSSFSNEIRAAYQKKLYDRRNKRIFMAIFLLAIIIWLLFLD